MKTIDGTESDEDLANRVKSGSKAAFEELINRYGSRLYHFLHGKMKNSQDVEDLVQETFLKAFKNIMRFDNRYKFSTWLYTIAHRLAISHLRKNRPAEAPVEAIESDLNPQDQWMHEEERSRLWYWARKLPQAQYRALWLRYIEEMSVREIGQVMKRSQIYIRVLLHRARLRLSQTVPSSIIPAKETLSNSAEGKLSCLAEGE
jgi:RNA polymerase sigma-70 factor (ECF subfamily)